MKKYSVFEASNFYELTIESYSLRLEYSASGSELLQVLWDGLSM